MAGPGLERDQRCGGAVAGSIASFRIPESSQPGGQSDQQGRSVCLAGALWQRHMVIGYCSYFQEAASTREKKQPCRRILFPGSRCVSSSPHTTTGVDGSEDLGQ